MAGTVEGAAKAAARNKERYGEDFYKKIGAIGGKKSSTGGFAAGEEGRKRAAYYGAIGGRKSRRGPNKVK